MEDISNVSSEEELLQLRNEEKITQEEYEELLTTLRQDTRVNVDNQIEQDKSERCRTSGLAIASLILSISSVILWPFGFVPGIICGHLARRQIREDPLIRGDGLAKAGLIIGYIFLCFLVCSILIFKEKAGNVYLGPTEINGFTVGFKPSGQPHVATHFEDKNSFSVESGSSRVEVKNLQLLVNNKPFGKVTKGDNILVDNKQGEVFVNSTKRGDIELPRRKGLF